MNAQSQPQLSSDVARPVAEIEETRRIAAVSPSSALLPRSFDQAVKLAEVMSKGKLVPVHLQNSTADCLMVIEQSMRWRMSPFAVGQCTSSIHGKLMFEGKLVAAAIYNSGILDGRFSYEFTGTGETRAVKVSAKIRGGKVESVDVALKDAKTTNEHWKKQPDQQLVYASTRIWARRHAPEVMLGVYVPEELEVIEGEVLGQHGASATAIEEKPAYEKEKFDKNLPEWRALVSGKKTTSAAILAKLESKATLTEEQRKTVLALDAPPPPATTEGGADAHA